MCGFDEDEIITTTTMVTEPTLNVIGGLKRQLEGTQFFVIDPADKQKIWINTNDDMYEDADGKVWLLV